MKKSVKTVLIPGLVISLLMLNGCQKVETPAPSLTSAVEETNIEVTNETAAEPTEAPKEDIKDEVKAEPTEAPKEESKDEDKPAADKESAENKDDDTKTDEAKPEEPEKSAVSLKDVYGKIAGSVALPEMYFADAGFLMNYYGIDASKLEDYVFASCLDSTSADSIILIRLKDESSADEVIGGLNMVLEQMSIELENYNPEANELVKAAKVRRNGKNIDLIIHKDRSTILSIIDSSL